MSLYDRDYLRDGWDGRRGGSGGWTATQALIVLNLAVFIAQLLWPAPGLEGILGVSLFTWTEGWHWQWVTAAFAHGGIWHIFLNLYALWWTCGELESIYGRAWAFLFYVATAVLSNGAFVLWAWLRGDPSLAIGASGAVMAFMTLYTFHYPRRQLLLFGILPLEMRWALLLFVLLDVSGALGHGQPIANAAHLGGAACGAAYALWKRRR